VMASVGRSFKILSRIAPRRCRIALLMHKRPKLANVCT
jgi:hypothetical protein